MEKTPQRILSRHFHTPMRLTIGPITENGEKLRDPAVAELRMRYRNHSASDLDARINELIAANDRSIELEYLKRFVWQLREWERARLQTFVPQEPIPRRGA